MKRTLLSLFCMLTCALTAMAQFESAPAFPGAEGHGRFVTGGRGGNIVHVTNLNDSGTGSLRNAVNGTAKKIVVFDVSGYIDLKSDLKIGSNTTILGQTAPGDGITLRYRTVVFTDCDNVIVRFVRFRRSQVKDVNEGADATWGRQHKNIILDHCSFSWSIDEVASFYDNQNFTMQWCNITEALANAGHGKGAHSYGGIWGGKKASFHHNLIAHVDNRSPRFNGARYNWTSYTDYNTTTNNPVEAERVDYRNCVMYNWGNGNGCYGGPGGGYINIINNYYKAGPATSNKTRTTEISVLEAGGGGEHQNYVGMTSRYYINGNYVTAAGAKAANYDWSGVKYKLTTYQKDNEYYTPDPNGYYQSEHTTVNGASCVSIKMNSPIEAGYVTTHTAEKAYEKVLAYSGASLKRDACDLRYVEEAKEGKTTFTGPVSKRAGILDLINDPSKTADPTLPSYPELATETRPAGFDTDNDGIPDEWETANGLNPNDPADAKTMTLDSKGYYTNLEVYANSLVEDIMKGGQADGDNAFEEYYPAFSKPTAITTVNADAPRTSNATYNLSGQRVSPNAKGVIIQNGKKIVK